MVYVSPDSSNSIDVLTEPVVALKEAARKEQNVTS